MNHQDKSPLELLALLEPASNTAHIAAMINDAGVDLSIGTSQACPGGCKNGRLIVGRDKKGNAVWGWCQACEGRGEFATVGGQFERKTSSQGAQAWQTACELLRGMPQHWYIAAMVFTKSDALAAKRLREIIRFAIINPMAETWEVDDELRETRAAGLSNLAVGELMRPANHKLFGVKAAEILRCSESRWSRVWKGRHETVVSTAWSWVYSAADYVASGAGQRVAPLPGKDGGRGRRRTRRAPGVVRAELSPAALEQIKHDRDAMLARKLAPKAAQPYTLSLNTKSQSSA